MDREQRYFLYNERTTKVSKVRYCSGNRDERQDSCIERRCSSVRITKPESRSRAYFMISSTGRQNAKSFTYLPIATTFIRLCYCRFIYLHCTHICYSTPCVLIRATFKRRYTYIHLSMIIFNLVYLAKFYLARKFFSFSR